MRMLVLALLLLLCCPPSSQAQQWVEHRPAGAGYQIQFPSAPKLRSETHGTEVRHLASVANKDNTRALMTSHSVRVNGPVESFDQIAKRLEQQGHKVLSQTSVTVSGKPALRLVVRDPDGYLVESVTVVQGRIRIQAIYASRTGEQTSQSRRFFASFALVPK